MLSPEIPTLTFALTTLIDHSSYVLRNYSPTHGHHSRSFGTPVIGPYNMDTTLLTTVDRIAREDPDRLYCIQPISSDIADGWKRISFRDVFNASNRMALWIQENVSSTERPEVFAYSAANDIRYVAIVLACMRLRHTVCMLFLSSTFCSSGAHATRHVI